MIEPRYRVIENGLGEFVVQRYGWLGRCVGYTSLHTFPTAELALACRNELRQDDDKQQTRSQVVRVID